MMDKPKKVGIESNPDLYEETSRTTVASNVEISTTSSGSVWRVNVKNEKAKMLKWIEGLVETHSFTTDPYYSDGKDRGIFVLEFDLTRENLPFDENDVRFPCLSEIISLAVKYSVEGMDEEKVGHFIIKTPTEEEGSRELGVAADVYLREIEFYSQVLPEMRIFINGENSKLMLGVPTCYVASINRQITDRPIPDLLNHVMDAENLFVFEDLRSLGYGKRSFIEGLSIDEAKAALREISRIHAVTWSMQTREQVPLHSKYEKLYGPKDSIDLYEALIENAFPALFAFLDSLDGKEEDSIEIKKRLVKLKGTLPATLESLICMPKYPSPTCLIQMDLWTDNLFFREKDSDDEDEILGFDDPFEEGEDNARTSGKREKKNLQCKILDWQMMTVGRPTHDVAMLILTSLSSKKRRENWHQLLHFYFLYFKKTVRSFGLELPFDLKVIECEYKKSQLLTTFFIISSIELVLMEQKTQNRFLDLLRDLMKDNII